MTRLILRNPFERRVDFTPDELATIRTLAEARQAPKEANLHLVEDRRFDTGRDNVEMHILGLLGEFAIAKLTAGAVDTKAYLAGDHGGDLSLYGLRIEVKTLQGYLALRSLDEFVADITVLVIYQRADYSSVWVQGWITKREFMAEHFIDNFGFGDRPCMQPAQLLPIDSLKAYCLATKNLRWAYARGHR